MTPAQRETILSSAALAPPDGVQANFVNPPSLHFLGPGVFQLVLVTLFVWMRYYTKVRIVKRVLVEDYALLVAWIFFAGAFNPILFFINELPMGVHQWNMTVRHLIQHDRYYTILKYAYTVVILPLKACIILQILRIFGNSPTSTSGRNLIFWLAHLFLGINITLYAIITIMQLTTCQPMARGWDPTIEGRCKDRRYMHIFTAAINTSSDIVLFLLPLREVWSLKVRGWWRRWGLRAVFLVGIFACIASAIRLYYSVTYRKSPDMTYQAALVARWSQVELTCGYLVACLPNLPRFVRHFAKAMGIVRSRENSRMSMGGGEAQERVGCKSGAVVTHADGELTVRNELSKANSQGH